MEELTWSDVGGALGPTPPQIPKMATDLKDGNHQHEAKLAVVHRSQVRRAGPWKETLSAQRC